MAETYTSFADMADAQQQKRLAKQRALQQQNQERFKEILSGQFEAFDTVRRWPLLQSTTKGIRALRFYRAPEMGDSLNIEIYYRDKNKKQSRELGSISKGGVFSMRLPKTLQHVDRDLLFSEILEDIDRLHPSVWVPLDSDIVVREETGKAKEGGNGNGGEEVTVDPQRIEFLRKQPDFLAGGIGGKKLNGYLAFLFRDMVVLDNQNIGNAAFVQKIENPLSDKEVTDAKTRSGRIHLIQNYIMPLIGRTRRELVAAGAERVVHKPHNEWVVQMIEKLNEVSPHADREVLLEEHRRNRSEK